MCSEAVTSAFEEPWLCLGVKRSAVRIRPARQANKLVTGVPDGRIQVIRTPIRAPRANAFAERWVRTVRTECLDWILVRGRRHLERVLRAYAPNNAGRLHRALRLATPERSESTPRVSANSTGLLRCDILGGLIHEYDRAA